MFLGDRKHLLISIKPCRICNLTRTMLRLSFTISITNIINPLSTDSKQHNWQRWKHSWDNQESNLGQLGERREHYICASSRHSPQVIQVMQTSWLTDVSVGVSLAFCLSLGSQDCFCKVITLSTEVELALLTQQPQIRFLAFPILFLNSWCCWD